ncbi:MAG: DMT family transporter, partial [Pseudomonadota bacterium]
MQDIAQTRLATGLVLLSGTVWGLYWLPVREIAALGLPGAWGSVGIGAAAVISLLPWAWRARRVLRNADPVGLLSIMLGGFAFILYSISFVYGQVAVVVILFFLTPVWSTLLGRIAFGWPVRGLRVLVLVCGLAGLAIMLGAEGGVPVPRSLGEWMGLASGFLWSLASTG